MKRSLALLTLVLLSAALVAAQDAASLAGDWLITSDVYGYPDYDRLTIKFEGGKLTGTASGTAAEITLTGNQFHATVKNPNSTDEFAGTLSGSKLSGTMTHTQKGETQPEKFNWTAERMPPRREGGPQRH